VKDRRAHFERRFTEALERKKEKEREREGERERERER
jgi:hypothetical protein